MAGLLKKWGFGAELIFDSGRAVVQMGLANKKVRALMGDFRRGAQHARNFGVAIGTIAAAGGVLGAAFGAATARGSELAATLEQQQLTMRVLLGSQERAADLMGRIRKTAAETPFQASDLIEGSKRLLRLTGDNVDRNMELLGVMQTMTALNPTKSIIDSVEALLDATSGGGFERMKEFGFAFKAEDFKKAGRPGGEAWGDAVVEALQERLTKLTKGEDLVGALSRTFSGRMSTLRDALDNVMLGLGQTVNERLGPRLSGITDVINGLAGPIQASFGRVLGFVDRLASRFAPVIARIREFFSGVDEGTRDMVLDLVIGASMVGGVVASVGAAVGAVVVVVGAVVAAGSALAGMGSAIAGMAATLGLSASAAANWGAVLAGVFAIVGKDRSIEFMRQTFTQLWTIGTGILTGLAAAASGFASGFIAGFSPIVDVVMVELRPALLELFSAVNKVLGEFATTGATATDVRSGFQVIGSWVGWFAQGILRPTIRLVGLFIEGAAAMLRVLRPVAAGIRRTGVAIAGLATGTLTAKEAFGLLAITVAQGVISIIEAVSTTIFSFIQKLLRNFADVASALGFAGIADTLGAGVESVGSARFALRSQFGAQIEQLNAAGSRIEQARARRAAPTVNVESPAVELNAQIESTLCLPDGRVVAQAVGETQIRDGERGAGKPLPPSQRGRVLRQGGVVTALKPAEVF